MNEKEVRKWGYIIISYYFQNPIGIFYSIKFLIYLFMS